MIVDVTRDLFLVVPMKVGGGVWCGCVGFFYFLFFGQLTTCGGGWLACRG